MGWGPLGRRCLQYGGRKNSVSDELNLALPSRLEQKKERGTRARSWKRKGEKKLGKNKPGKNLFWKSLFLVPALPYHTPKPRHWAIGCGHKVYVVSDGKPLGIQSSWGEAKWTGGRQGPVEVTTVSLLSHHHWMPRPYTSVLKLLIVIHILCHNIHFKNKQTNLPFWSQYILIFSILLLFFLILIATHSIVL